MSAFTYTLEPFGEHGLLATLRGREMVATALAANAIADRMRTATGIMDSLAGIDSVAVRFHPDRTNVPEVSHLLENALRDQPAGVAPPSARIDIPVCYGGDFGPDFDVLCERLALHSQQLVDLHSSTPYRVLTIGFAPGFAYMGPLSDALQTERLAQPRPVVPAGSIGVAGAMTGVYSLASPGGWPLIGRTPVTLFDSAARDPFIFKTGAEVRFTPIDAQRFAELSTAT